MIQKKIVIKGYSPLSIHLFHGLFSSPGFFSPFIDFLRSQGGLYLYELNFVDFIDDPSIAFDFSDRLKSFCLPGKNLFIFHSFSSIILNFSNNKFSGDVDFVSPPFFVNLIRKNLYLLLVYPPMITLLLIGLFFLLKILIT
jgi:hypothetical protein